MGTYVRFSLLVIYLINILFFRAADFNCRLPANTNSARIFVLTIVGVLFPIVSIGALGSLLMTVPAYAMAYATGDAAAVISKSASSSVTCKHFNDAFFTQVFEHWGHGGDFILVLLALSEITCNGT